MGESSDGLEGTGTVWFFFLLDVVCVMSYGLGSL
jgi:hypothetical protein